ncbi:MAG: hypothetical protein QNL33_12545 [Akkermansiaceae bacterium]
MGLAALLAPMPLFGQFNCDLTGYWPLDSDLLDGSGKSGDGSFNTNGAVTTPTFTSGGAGTTA